MPVPANATQVIPRLWQGGKPKPGVYSFDLIILCDDEYQPPDGSFPGSQIARVMLNDYRLPTPAEWAAALSAARTAADWYQRGKSILVTCGAGLNRSGLITGLTLKLLGYSTDQAVSLIRAARGDRAIRNSAFIKFIDAISASPSRATSPIVIAGALAAALGLVFAMVRRFR